MTAVPTTRPKLRAAPRSAAKPAARGTGPQVAKAGVVQPWATSSGVPEGASLKARGGRPCLMTPMSVDAVMIADTGEWLPDVGQWTDDRRLTWRKFELPAPTREGELGSVDERIHVRLYSDGRARGVVSVSLEGALPRLRRPATDTRLFEEHDSSDLHDLARKQGSSPAPALPSRWGRAAALAHRMVDRHIELVTRLTESAGREAGSFHDGPGGGLPVWPLEAVLDTWAKVDLADNARRPLIVHMARTLPAVLSDVCMHPRKVLARERRLQDAGQISEVDADCLRWLARQPGRTVAEKSGVKQRAMGIARVENADTLENRLVRDLLRRAMTACRRYLDDHGTISPPDDVADVERFQATIGRLWQTSPIASVGQLTGVPRPNHALQHDRRYHTLWKAYVQLLRQQVEQDQAWRWRHRIWAEACGLALLGALKQAAPGVPRASALQSDVLLRNGQVCGRFIDERSGIGRFDVIHGETASTIQLLRGDEISAYRAVAPFPDQLSSMCPDAVLVCRDAPWPDKPARHVLGIWTALDFDLEGDGMAERAERIDAGMRAIRSAGNLTGLLLQPTLSDSAEPVRRGKRVGTCQAIRLTLPLQPHAKALGSFLMKELELV